MNKDTFYAEYILSILKSDVVKMMSWGFCKPTIIKNGLRFYVNGFLHQGWVEVIFNEATDDFKVVLLSDAMQHIQTYDMIYFDTLVDVIDSVVEKCRDYSEQVKVWLNGQI